MRLFLLLFFSFSTLACKPHTSDDCPTSEAVSGWNGITFAPNTYSAGTYYCDTIISANLKSTWPIWFVSLDHKAERWNQASISATFQTRCNINGKMWIGLDNENKTLRSEGKFTSQSLTLSARMPPGNVPFYIALEPTIEQTIDMCPVIIQDVHTFILPEPPQMLP